MTGKSLWIGAAAALLVGAGASAQTASPAPNPPPSDQATQPLNSATPSGTPYSDSGSGLPSDPSNMPPMHASPSARDNASDSAARTTDTPEEKAINRCKAMPGDQAMRDSTCAALMKKHPTMMNGSSGPQ